MKIKSPGVQPLQNIDVQIAQVEAALTQAVADSATTNKRHELQLNKLQLLYKKAMECKAELKAMSWNEVHGTAIDVINLTVNAFSKAWDEAQRLMQFSKDEQCAVLTAKVLIASIELYRSLATRQFKFLDEGEQQRYYDRSVALMAELNKLSIPEKENFLIRRREHYNITVLGLEENLSERLNAAEQNYLNHPTNSRVIEEYGWRICDLIEQAGKIGETEVARSYMERLDNLSISEESHKLLSKKHSALKSNLSYADNKEMQARAESKQGNHENAAALYEEALREMGNDQPKEEKEAVTKNLAWEWWRILKQVGIKLLKQQGDAETQVAMAWKLAQRFVDMKCDDWMLQCTYLRSMSYIQAQYPHNNNYIAMLQDFGIALFDTAIFYEEPPAAKKSNNMQLLPELVLKNLFHIVKSYQDWQQKTVIHFGSEKAASAATPELDEKAVSVGLANQAVDRCLQYIKDERSIVFYYAGCIKLWQGLAEDAVGLLSRFVLHRWNESWAWSRLAEAYEHDEQVMLSLSVRGYLCPVENDQYLQKLRTKISRLMKVREEKPIVLSEWLRKNVRQAEESVTAQLAWQNAVIVGIHAAKETPETTEKPVVTYCDVLVNRGNGMAELIRDQQLLLFQDDALKKGTAVRVKGCEDAKGYQIKCLELRPQPKEPWDILPWECGVVSRVVLSRRFCEIMMEDECITVFFQHHRKAGQFKTGDYVKLKRMEKASQDVLCLACSEQDVELPFVQIMEGVVETKNVDGSLIIHDVFIPHHLAAVCKIRQQDHVRLLAVRRANRWKAITVERI